MNPLGETSDHSPGDLLASLSSRRSFLRWTGLLLASYVALVVLAAVPWGRAAALAVLVVLVVEVVVDRHAPEVPWMLAQLQFDVPARSLVRGLALVLLASRLGYRGLTAIVVAAVLLVAVSHAVLIGGAQVVQHLRRPPVLATGLALDPPRLPRMPTAVLTGRRPVAAVVEVIAVLAVVVSVQADVDDRTVVVVTGLVLAAAFAAVPTAVTGWYASRLFRSRLRQRLPRAIERELDRLAPRTAVYFGDGPDWRYQVEVWLPVLEQLDRPLVIIVRDHDVLRTLPPTTVPVISVPTARALLQMRLPSLRASLFVGNNAHNLHLLRRPELRSAFIGHGDSDKGASANPFSRVYNEIWVAGPAGRERYRAGGVDVHDDAFVEVGRPQLDLVPRAPDAVPMPTVLYAPTWEGWGESANHSSVATIGPALVRALLARPGLRVMYRPHPRVGHLDPGTRAAHRKILALLRAAGAEPSTPTPPRPSDGPRAARDALERTLQPETRPDGLAGAVAEWEHAFWAARPGHRILTEPAPTLYSCFAVADLLISDISSVTSDFLAADRPYAVVNALGAPVEEFRASAGIARGGFVIDPGLGGLDDALAALEGDDPSAADRAKTRSHLVACYGAESLAAFDDAIARLEEHRSPRAGR